MNVLVRLPLENLVYIGIILNVLTIAWANPLDCGDGLDPTYSQLLDESALLKRFQQIDFNRSKLQIELDWIQGRTLIFKSNRSGETHIVSSIVSIHHDASKGRPIVKLKTSDGEEYGFDPIHHVPIAVREPLKRRFPPLSTFDTVLIQPDGKKIPHHGSGKDHFFKDSEILAVESNLKVGELESPTGKIPARLTADGKHIIQQQGVRGCTAAATEMLIADHRGGLSMERLRQRNLGDTDMMIRDLQNAGLDYVSSHLNLDSKTHAKDLSRLVAQNGPAIIDIGGELGGHVVILDAIDLASKTARLRDPHHGWMITVKLDRFLKRYNGGSVLQIKSK